MTDTAFRRRFLAGWGDMDFNAHMRNTAFLDRAADVRMMFFAEHGFPMSEFRRMRIGPVVRRDEISYQREVGLLESFEVTLEVAGVAADGSRFLLRNAFFREDGTPCASVTSAGGWLDLAERRLTAPPPALFAAMQQLVRTSDWCELPSSLARRDG